MIYAGCSKSDMVERHLAVKMGRVGFFSESDASLVYSAVPRVRSLVMNDGRIRNVERREYLDRARLDGFCYGWHFGKDGLCLAILPRVFAAFFTM